MTQELLNLRDKWIKTIVILIFVSLFILNGRTLIIKADHFLTKNVNDSNNSVLGETEFMARYIINNADREKAVYFTGKRDYVRRFFNPLEYLMYGSGVELKNFDIEEKDIDRNRLVFFVVKSENKKYKIGMNIDGYKIKKVGIFNKVTVLTLDDYEAN